MKRFHIPHSGRDWVYGEDTPVFDHGVSTMPVSASKTQCCVPTPKIETNNEVSSCCAK